VLQSAQIKNSPTHIIFTGGGTGGHIYPNIAVAQRIKDLAPNTNITFFVSSRPIDKLILAKYDFQYQILDVKPFTSKNPIALGRSAVSFLKTYSQVKSFLRKFTAPQKKSAPTLKTVLIATGGFVSIPTVFAAKNLHIPIFLLNVDSVPGKANKLLASFAQKIFTQFPHTNNAFKKHVAKTVTVGCPLRKEFLSSNPQNAIKELSLDPTKKILLITGASSGSVNINSAFKQILPHLASYKDNWQLVLIAGIANYEKTKSDFASAPIPCTVIPYYHNTADLFAAASLIISRAGAVSVAEIAASKTPAIFIPYPYHKDKHQYLNAKYLADAGSALIINDHKQNTSATANELLEHLLPLLSNPEKLNQMSLAMKNLSASTADSALVIAQTVLGLPST